MVAAGGRVDGRAANPQWSVTRHGTRTEAHRRRVLAGCRRLRDAHPPRFVQTPFSFAIHDVAVTISGLRLPTLHPADSVAVERLWDALSSARVGERRREVADLEDAVYQWYLPMARTLSDRVRCDTGAERRAAEHAAELGLAHAVLEWQQPTSGGFRRFARASVLRQLLNRRLSPDPH